MPALRGLLGEHQRRMLAAQLRHIDFLEAEVATLSADVAERMRPSGAAVALVDSVPGVALRTAEAILAEVGPDMSRFPSAAHLASWARVCPGTDESAGRRRSGATGPGNAWLRTALVEAAHAAARTKGTTSPPSPRRRCAGCVHVQSRNGPNGQRPTVVQAARLPSAADQANARPSVPQPPSSPYSAMAAAWAATMAGWVPGSSVSR
ncbi:MAG: IS110 family transposase [Deltaproteobacteria bacterium]|nr:IS110 family transposase [Deltaproteobacteria bacterium]